MKDRTEYFRNYARNNREKRAAIKKAWRERNKAKVAAYARNYRAEHAGEPRKPRAPRIVKPKTDAAKAEALESLKDRFAAFRASRQGVAS